MAATTAKKNSKKAKDNPQVINLATNAGREAYDAADDRVFGFDPLIFQGSPSGIRYGKFDLFNNEDMKVFVLDNNALYGTGTSLDQIDKSDVDRALNDVPSAFVIRNPQKRNKANKNCAVLLLLNGDEDTGEGDPVPDYTLVGNFDRQKFPTFSLNCFSRFYPKEEQAIEALRSGNAMLLDFSEDDTIGLTAAERRQLESKDRKKPLLPPKPGYSLVYNQWHRSATVLIYDKKKDFTLLIGQDEGTYFGVELPENCKTLGAAYNSLIPKEARNKEFKRQGEWFAVEVDDKEVPQASEAVLIIESPTCDQDTHLPMETEDSNKHWFDGGEIRVAKSGTVYYSGCCLKHDEHSTLVLRDDRWYTFHKNTAVRSFSQKGVD